MQRRAAENRGRAGDGSDGDDRC